MITVRRLGSNPTPPQSPLSLVYAHSILINFTITVPFSFPTHSALVLGNAVGVVSRLARESRTLARCPRIKQIRFAQVDNVHDFQMLQCLGHR